jgi:electron transport complex protein RnfG
VTEQHTVPPAPPSRWMSAGRLAAAVLAMTAIIGITAVATRQRITDNQAAQTMKVIGLVLPPGLYDNQPGLDRAMVLAPALLGSEAPVPVYRARRNGAPAAAVITVIARQGYVGPIRLLVSVAADGRVLAARAVAHEETPGLGDRIDTAKSDWMSRFTGRSADKPTAERWGVRRDGGDFDELTGATITSRAVVDAVHNALLYFQQHRDEIFQQPSE